MEHQIKNTFLVLDQTDELTIKVVGETLKDLFVQALLGLAHTLHHNYEASGVTQTSVTIKISSIDVNSLMVDFLSEVLYQSELHQAVFFKIKFKRFTNSELEADLFGRPATGFEHTIKAVAYHGVRILRNADGLWQTAISFTT